MTKYTCYSAPGLMSVDEQMEKMTIEQKILFLIRREFGVTEEDLLSGSRHLEIVLVRHFWRYLLRQIADNGHPKYTLNQVGRMTGMASHCTIIWSCGQALNLIETDKEYRQKYINIMSNLGQTMFL